MGSIGQNRRLVAPRTLKGFRDILPAEMIAQNRVLDRIKRVFEAFGFVPLDSPVLEHLATLIGTGGEEANKEMFRLKSPEGEGIAMRYDLTVPFARLLAQYPNDLKLPFRRYHIGPVFRTDKPDPGRFRQFTQCDVDVAGSRSVSVDAEIVAIMCAVMHAVGLHNDDNGEKRFEIRINSRNVLQTFLAGLGIEDEDGQASILRAIDKLQKIGQEAVAAELGEGRVDRSGDPIPGVGLDSGTVTKIIDFVSIDGTDRASVASAIVNKLPSTEPGQAAAKELLDLTACLESLDIAGADVVVDPSLARGLAYYTGPIFEATLPIAPEMGSVMGGGRYDNLVDRFLQDSIPATGMSIGLDRLIAALLKLNLLTLTPTITEVLVMPLSGKQEFIALKAASTLRDSSVRTEVYFGSPNTALRDQLSFANARNIPVAVIVGDDEEAAGTFAVKDLGVGLTARSDIRDREQFRERGKVGQVTVPTAELVAAVKKILNAND